MDSAKVLLLDIEASDLCAEDEVVFCVCYKWLHAKTIHTVTLRSDPKAFTRVDLDDSHVLEAIRPAMEDADIIVHHYGDRFDIPFLQTRCLQQGLKPLPSTPSIDTWRIAKYRLKFRSNRLDYISRVLGTNEKKTPLTKRTWKRAFRGHVPSLKEIEHHCRQDILVLEEVYLKTRPFSKAVPDMAVAAKADGCPKCASTHVHRRGRALAGTTIKIRYQCQACGGWFLRATAKAIKE